MDTINIISNSAKSSTIRGPQKVFANVCKGFERIGQPYVVNKDITSYRYNWIHDSIEGLIDVSIKRIPSVVGPNIVVLPGDLPKLRFRLENCIYLHPSDWVVKTWEMLGFNECKILSWPCGIDVDAFYVERSTNNTDNVMVYNKYRNPEFIKRVTDTVKGLGLTPHLITYGEYSEQDFKELISKCSFGVWAGMPESQGIALQEVLASDMPMIVLDVESLFDTHSINSHGFPEVLRNVKVSSAPYFDARCGIIINDIGQLKNAIEQMRSNLNLYSPRDFIKEELSLEVSAKKLLDIFGQLNILKEPRKSGNNNFEKEFEPGFLTRMICRAWDKKALYKAYYKKITEMFVKR